MKGACIRCAGLFFNQAQRPHFIWESCGFGSFDNSTCKRVLDLLEPGDLRLGQVVIKRVAVAVVKLGVNSGSGDGGSCFGIEVWTDTAKLTNNSNSKIWRQVRSGREK